MTTSMFMSIIFFVTCYPILLAMYFMLRNSGDKNAYCFGATLKKELRNDDAVKAIDAEFRKNLKWSTIILGIIPIPFAFIPYFSISMSLWMFWILAICFIPSLWFAIANRKIKDLKQERGWNEERSVSYTDLKTASVPRKVKLVTFLPALILSTIPIIIACIIFQGHGYEIYGWLVALFGLCTYLFYACAVWTDKQKITIICEDSDTNMNYARAKKQVWKNFSLACAWINTAFTWFILFLMWQSGLAVSGVIWGTIVYCVAIMGITGWIIKKIFDINKTYEAKRTIFDAADDDKNWIWGQVYYNKNDKHYMIESRLGTGTTVNLGNKAGMVTIFFSVVAVLSIPIVSIWIILAEFTPIQVTVEDDVIICQQLNVDYEIPLADIDAYTTVTELPEMTKVNGSGMDNLLIGTFEVYREGMFEVFLNPQNDLFIKLTVDEQVYYIGGADDETTQEVLDAIEEYMK
ncbi:MAG: hypothetical protein IJ419_04500 [Agathobacter sp.]|nr:hypothetical protein [Agathobacter sp.]